MFHRCGALLSFLAAVVLANSQVFSGPVHPCAVLDEDEPGNNLPASFPRSAKSAGNISTIHEDGDVDWYGFQFLSSGPVTAFTSNLSGTNPDSVLELYDNNGQLLAYNDDANGGRASSLTWESQSGAFYHLKVTTYGGTPGSFDNLGGGPGTMCYELFVHVTLSLSCTSPDASDLFENPELGLPVGAERLNLTFHAAEDSLDRFQVYLEAGQELTLEVTDVFAEGNAPPAMTVFLVDTSSNAILHDVIWPSDSTERVFQYTVSESGPYPFEIANNDGTTPTCYTLTVNGGPPPEPCAVSDNMEFGNAPASAFPIGVPVDDFNSTLHEPGDVDWYAFTAEAPERFFATLEATDGSNQLPELELFKGDGSFVFPGYDPNPVTVEEKRTRVVDVTLPEAGQYYLKVRSGPLGTNGAFDGTQGGPGTMCYRLETRMLFADDPCGIQDFVEPNNSLDTATGLALNTPYSGTIAQFGDRDYFWVSLQEGQQVVASTSNLTGGNPDTILSVFGPMGEVIESSDDGQGTAASAVVWTADSPGSYYVLVEAKKGFPTLCYGLEVQLLSPTPTVTATPVVTATPTSPNDPCFRPEDSEPNNVREEAHAISLDTDVVGTILTDGDVDWYAVEVVAGQRYTAYTWNLSGSPTPDSVLELYDSQGNELAFNDDWQGSRASFLGWKADSAGPYYLKVSAFQGLAALCYTLTVSSDPCAVEDDSEPSDLPMDGLLVSTSTSVLGSIHEDGDVDWLRVEVAAGERLIIEVQNPGGTNPDPAMALYNEAGTKLAENDNNDPGGLGSRAAVIEYEADADQLLFAKIFSAGGDGGGFDALGGGPATMCYQTFITIIPSDEPCAEADFFEPNNNRDEATAVVVDQISIPGTIHHYGDRDFFHFSLEAGGTLTAALSNQTGTNPFGITTLVNSGGEFLEGGFGSLTYQALASGSYYLIVDAEYYLPALCYVVDVQVEAGATPTASPSPSASPTSPKPTATVFPTATPTATVTATTPVSQIPGDANGDGVLTPGDAQATFECYLFGSCAPGISSTLANFCGGERITPSDAQGIFNQSLGVENPCD